MEKKGNETVDRDEGAREENNIKAWLKEEQRKQSSQMKEGKR